MTDEDLLEQDQAPAVCEGLGEKCGDCDTPCELKGAKDKHEHQCD